VWNALYGNKSAARKAAETALKTFEGREVAYAAGFALGLAGDAARAEALADKLNKEYPGDTNSGFLRSRSIISTATCTRSIFAA